MFGETERRNTDINALNTHIDITKATTRLEVTSSWYLRWRCTAKNLSPLRAMTPKNDAVAKKYEIARIAVHKDELSRCNNHFTSSPKYNGSTSKPTPRSETARLRNNVFGCFGNDEDFLRAWIVTLFKMMAVIARNALKTLLTMYHDFKFSFFVFVGWYCSNSSQTRFSIILNVFNS